jgi:hypothetical protein
MLSPVVVVRIYGRYRRFPEVSGVPDLLSPQEDSARILTRAAFNYLALTHPPSQAIVIDMDILTTVSGNMGIAISVDVP